MKMDFTEKCDDVLCALYAEVGDDVTKVIVINALVGRLGYHINELMAIADYLNEERYITWHRTIGGGVLSLTGKGIMYAQNGRKKKSHDFDGR